MNILFYFREFSVWLLYGSYAHCGLCSMLCAREVLPELMSTQESWITFHRSMFRTHVRIYLMTSTDHFIWQRDSKNYSDPIPLRKFWEIRKCVIKRKRKFPSLNDPVIIRTHEPYWRPITFIKFWAFIDTRIAILSNWTWICKSYRMSADNMSRVHKTSKNCLAAYVRK